MNKELGLEQREYLQWLIDSDLSYDQKLNDPKKRLRHILTPSQYKVLHSALKYDEYGKTLQDTLNEIYADDDKLSAIKTSWKGYKKRTGQTVKYLRSCYGTDDQPKKPFIMSFEFNGTPVDFETFVDTNRLRNADAYEMMLSLQVGQAMNFGNGNLLERVK